MNKILSPFKYLLPAALVILSGLAFHEVANANQPNCAYLYCFTSADCGTSCYCNTPASKCYSN